MAQAELAVLYDGSALKTGAMPVADLAPALLALGELFVEASEVAYPGAPPVALNIRATERGSFLAQLLLIGDDLRFAGSLLSSDGAGALANLIQIVEGAFSIIKFARGRSLHGVEPVTNQPGLVRVTIDGASIEVPSASVDFSQRVTVIRKAREVVRPLERSGVDVMQIIDTESKVSVEISPADVPYFDPVDSDPDESVSESERLLELVSVDFERSRWRFSEGHNGFTARVIDQAFLERVRQQELSFTSGDRLRCRVLVRQSLRNGKLDAKYEIVKVVRHYPAGSQLSF